MSDNAIRDAVQKLAGTYDNVDVTVCLMQVVSVDKPSRTCIVNSLDSQGDNDGTPVKLMPEVADGILLIPKEDSTIAICYSPITPPFAIQYSELDEILLIVGDQSYNILPDSQIFNDGSYGGIPKIIDPNNPTQGLLKKINNLETILNDLQTKFVAWIPVPNDGGAALKTILTATPPIWNIPQITPTTQAEIENASITHGPSLPDG